MKKWILVFYGLSFLAGCQTKTEEIRSRAGALGVRVGEYRQQQADRLQRVNEEYSANFSRLMDAFAALSRTELELGRVGSRLVVPESMIV